MQSFNQQELLERLNQPEWRNFQPTRARNKAPNDIIGSWQELGYPTPEIINTKAAKCFELVVHEVEEWQLALLTACHTPRKRQALQDIVGVSHRDTVTDNNLQPLLNEGLLTRTIPDKPTNSRQRYVVTDAGRALLTASKEP